MAFDAVLFSYLLLINKLRTSSRACGCGEQLPWRSRGSRVQLFKARRATTARPRAVGAALRGCPRRRRHPQATTRVQDVRALEGARRPVTAFCGNVS